MLWFKGNPHQQGRICPGLQRRLVAELKIIHHFWASALSLRWSGFMGAGVGVDKRHTVSLLTLPVTARSPILRVKRGTFPAAQPPLLSSPPSTQQMHCSSVLSCIQPQSLLALTLPVWSWFSLVSRGEWIFSWSSPVPGTWELASVPLKYSSESRYSNLLSLLLSCKVQITSLFKACSFLNSEINVAGFLVYLIVFYLSTCGFADD